MIRPSGILCKIIIDTTVTFVYNSGMKNKRHTTVRKSKKTWNVHEHICPRCGVMDGHRQACPRSAEEDCVHSTDFHNKKHTTVRKSKKAIRPSPICGLEDLCKKQNCKKCSRNRNYKDYFEKKDSVHVGY